MGCLVAAVPMGGGFGGGGGAAPMPMQGEQGHYTGSNNNMGSSINGFSFKHRRRRNELTAWNWISGSVLVRLAMWVGIYWVYLRWCVVHLETLWIVSWVVCLLLLNCCCCCCCWLNSCYDFIENSNFYWLSHRMWWKVFGVNVNGLVLLIAKGLCGADVLGMLIAVSEEFNNFSLFLSCNFSSSNMVIFRSWDQLTLQTN